jgi:hypothetical protein
MGTVLFLVPDTGFKASFDADDVRRSLTSLAGVTNYREGKETGLGDLVQCDCDYACEDDWTRVSVSKDLKAIALSGTGTASLGLALEFQKHYGKELWLVVSESPSDKVNLATGSSVEELRSHLNL